MVDILIFRVDQFSFWVGFFGGILFSWLIYQIVKFAPRILRSVGTQIQLARENLTTGTENRIRQDILNWAQQQHLASSIFALDEILIEPKLLAPPPYSTLEGNYDLVDISTSTVPYMPDWPEMGAVFGSPTLTFKEALTGGSDILVIGQPGSGKTVALASLASQIARRDPAIGELTRMFPLIIPAPTLANHIKNNEPIDSLIQTMVGCYISPVVRPRLKGLLSYLLQAGRVLLLLDGMDELNRQTNRELHEYLVSLKEMYPGIRMVISASPGDFAELNQLGMTPLGIAGWNENTKHQFIQKWHEGWSLYIEPNELSGIDFVDTLLLEKWLCLRDINHSPFDITLKTWAVFSGDLIGPDKINLIEAHIRRMTVGFSNADDILQAIAAEMVSKFSPSISQRDAEIAANRSGKAVATTPIKENDDIVIDEEDSGPRSATVTSRPGSASQIISLMLRNGLLVSSGDSHISFSHPFFMGYLASRSITKSAEKPNLVEQVDWTGKQVTLGFLSAFEDITESIEILIDRGHQSLLHNELFQAARWMNLASKKSTWRAAVMRQLLRIIQTDYETLSLSGRAVSALALSEDPGIGALFKELLKSDQTQIRQLAALGLGVLGENKFVSDLALLTDDISPVVSKAACLGLIGIGNQSALENVISVLLHGTEDMRRAAAESLVNNYAVGIELLKEGLTMEDLLVRRAVIFGLARTKDPEITALLEKTAIEDAQWVVKNAAAQAIEKAQLPNPSIPAPFQPLTQQSWLINFAGKSGIGVGDEEHGFDLVLQAMERGEQVEKLRALEYLRQYPRESAVPRLYGVFYGSQDDKIREASYDAIWHAASSGINLPPPVQFGLG